MFLFLAILCAAIAIFMGILMLRAFILVLFGGLGQEPIFRLVVITLLVLITSAAGYGAFYFGSQIG